MKKVFCFDYENKFIGVAEAELCQVTEQRKMEQAARELKPGEVEIESVFILPAYSTEVAAPEIKEGFDLVFNGKEWEHVAFPLPEPEPAKYEPTYEELRRSNYPDIYEYIDGVVKGDQAQIAAYIQKCKDVKAKFPKNK